MSKPVRFGIIAALIIACSMAVIGYFIIHKTHAASADINGDGKVDIIDLSIMASNWGKTGRSFAQGDINGDGTVNLIDLSILASNWGTTVGTSDPTIVAAGDIACDPTDPNFNNLNGISTDCQMKATSSLIQSMKPSAAITLGDNQYESGTLSNFLASYDKTWGMFKAISHPAIGNHEGGEGQTHSNAGYFDYFNGAGVKTGLAGDRSKGYYSYNIGTWHLIALNSNCGTYWFGGVQSGCQAGSPQELWLKADLAANSSVCTLAYWHVPRFSSGSVHHNDASSDTVYATFWNDLYSARADVVLNGHDHDYERFGPQQPNGTADAANGIREFVVGVGGKNYYSFAGVVANSQLRKTTDFGALKLTLKASSYDWQFVDITGAVVDSGSGNCH